jgi:hypothetical protein
VRTIYGVTRADELARIGTCNVIGNHVVLKFLDDQLQRIGDDLRAFILLGCGLKIWPAEAMGEAGSLDQAKVWANPRGKRMDHRPLVWAGRAVSDELAVLVPQVKVDKLADFEHLQDGFLRRLPGRQVDQ